MKIMCAETLWENDVSSSRTSYKSILDSVVTETGDTLSYFTFNTPQELDNLFSVFKKSKYDLFYLGSHMRGGNITSGYRKEFTINVYDAIKRNKAALTNKVLHLSGCSSVSDANLDIDKVRKICKLRAVSGYMIDTDTTESAAMDLIYLTNLSRNGVTGLYKLLTKRYGCLVRISGFKIYDLKEV